MSLGRGSENDIVIDSASVSGKHAEMRRVEGGYELADLGSTNGIKFEGTRKQMIPLRSGMTVRMGDVNFDFTLSEELETIARERSAQTSPIEKEIEEEAPQRKRSAEDLPDAGSAPRSVRKPVVKAPALSPLAAFVMLLVFLVLASGAFYAGLDIRHRKETGESLIKGIVNKPDAAKAAPAADGDKKAE